MAETLKARYGLAVPRRVADMVSAVYPAFDRAGFLCEALLGYEALELMSRGQHMARALRHHLPADVPAALGILVASLAPAGEPVGADAMGVFVYLPHSFFIAEHGLAHFEPAMAAMHALTQRFTAEFCLRPYLVKHQEATLARLHQWATDPSEHVRRLVSEGTRPRLPWAPRLPAFQRNPTLTLALLERLKDDPSGYVRRSVANHLHDVGKDHPELLVETTRQWWKRGSTERRWIVRHALRTAVKRGDAGALAVLGFEPAQLVRVDRPQVAPSRVPIGAAVELGFELRNVGGSAVRVLVDLRVHYVRPGGRVHPKVFKLKVVDLLPGQTVAVHKTLSLAQLSTRRHHPGHHRVDALVNGRAWPVGGFEVVDEQVGGGDE